MTALASRETAASGLQLELRSVGYHYHTGGGISDISCVMDQPVVALIGANGAGKSTLLRLVSGLRRCHIGLVRWNGRERGWLRRQGVGYAPDLGQDEGALTVFQAVHFWAAQWLPRGRRIEATTRALAALGIASRAEQRLDAQSFGNQRKVLIAGAIVHEPQLLCLDEPTAGLDDDSVQLLIEVIARRRELGQLTIVASNDGVFVHSIADTVIPLQAGSLSVMDPAAHLGLNSAFVARIATKQNSSDTVSFSSAEALADAVRGLAESGELDSVQIISGRRPRDIIPADSQHTGRYADRGIPFLRQRRPGSLSTRELLLSLTSSRRLLLKMAIPLILSLPLVVGHAPSFWAASLLSVLVCMVGCVGTAVGFAHARQGTFLERLQLVPKPRALLLMDWMAGIVLVDAIQLTPTLIALCIAGGSWENRLVLIASTAAALLAAATIGALVSTAGMNVGELLIDSIVLLAPALFFAGLFTGIPSGGWSRLAASIDPFTYLHESLIAVLGGITTFSSASRLLAAGLTSVICTLILSAIAPKVIR